MSKKPPPPQTAVLPVIAVGVPKAQFRDLYHRFLRLSWPLALGLIVALFLGLNVVFAALYFQLGGIANARPGSFADAFFFSVQTMATIGYGGMAPANTVAHLVVTLESFVGIVYTAVVTGVFFSKFSAPSARVQFSSPCVVADVEGVPTLMFRCANTRETTLVEATVTVTITRAEVLSDGENVRRLYDLDLRRNTSPLFALSWTVMHPIVPGSPLYGRTIEQIERESTTLICTMTAIDDTLASTVHTRWSWTWRDFRWRHKFADMLQVGDGVASIDFSRIDDVVPAPLTLPVQA